MNFDQAFQKLLGVEGDYADLKGDPGGKTRFGITEAVARAKGYDGDMRALPLELAQAIYRADYWERVRAPELPIGLRYVMFDAAVNSGSGQAIRWLQQALGVPADGVFGPRTMDAVNNQGADGLRMKLLAQRLRFMTGLPQWAEFSRGWTRRICDLLEA